MRTTGTRAALVMAVLGLVGALLPAGAASADVAPPANDALANAEVLVGSLPVSTTGTNAGATAEAGEPDRAEVPAAASVWFSWTPTAAAAVVVTTCGSSFDTVVGVYTGAGHDVSSLTEVASNDDACDVQSRVRFVADAGTTYLVAIDGFGGATGTIALSVEADPAPANDAVAAAEELSATLPLTVSGTTVDATHESGEPRPADTDGGASVWYRWTPAASGPVVVDSCSDGAFDPVVAVYGGTATPDLASLAPVASAMHSCGAASTTGLGDRVTFAADAGTTYWLAIDGLVRSQTGLETGAFTLHLSAAHPPANDDLAAAQVLTGASVDASGTNVDATVEPGEPVADGNKGGVPVPGGSRAGGSVWYRWNAPSTGSFVVDTCNSGFDSQLQVFAGTTFPALVPLGADDDSCTPDDVTSGAVENARVGFRATAGTTYSIAVAGYDSGRGPIRLRLRAGAANDSFADRVALAGALPLTVQGTTVGALVDEVADETVGVHGVWYSFTPAASGRYSFDTCGSFAYFAVSLFTGTDPSALEAVPSTNVSCAGTNRDTFDLVGGTTYAALVSSPGGSPFELAVRVAAPRPANDDQSHASRLPSPLPLTVEASIAAATREPGEPGDDVDGPTVWYRWTPTRSTTVTAVASGAIPIVRAYTGTALGDLVPVTSRHHDGIAPDRQEFDAVAGVTYWLQLTSNQGLSSSVQLELRVARPPANDTVDQAQRIAGDVPRSVQGTTVDATPDTVFHQGHDDGSYDGSTVWYRWTAPRSRRVTVDSCGSDVFALVDVYTGTTDTDLVPLDASFGECPNRDGRAVTFDATGGTTYWIRVDGYGQDHRWGDFHLRLRAGPAPAPNDAFADAMPVSGALPIHVVGSNVGATREPGEPDHSSDDGVAPLGLATVWYRWVPSTSGRVVVDVTRSDFGAVAGVHTGPDLAHLTLVGDGPVYDVHAGATYWIAVGSRDLADFDPPRYGTIDLVIRASAPPANDAFAAAIRLQGSLPIRVRGTTADATVDAGQPAAPRDIASSDDTVWYAWTPARTERVVVETCGTTVHTALLVYEGTLLTALSTVAVDDQRCAPGAQVTFAAQAGHHYRIALSAQIVDQARGQFPLTIRRPSPPRNDDLRDATTIFGTSRTVAGTTVDATREDNEPYHGGLGDGASVWYQWTAPTSGLLTVDTCGSSAETLLAAYAVRGGAPLGFDRLDRVDSASALTCRSHDADVEGSRLTIPVQRGVTYTFAVDANDPIEALIPLRGPFRFHLQLDRPSVRGQS